MQAVVSRPPVDSERRWLAISDVHGNLDYLKGLLKKVSFTPDDELFILGDMVEKGVQSLDTVRYIMELMKTHRVYPLCGNCDAWHSFIDSESEEMDKELRRYLVERGNGWNQDGLIAQMCLQLGIEISPHMDMERTRRMLKAEFSLEFDFLRSLPHIIDTPDYTFVHGGIQSMDFESLDAYACMKYDNFMNQGKVFDKYVVVGHWPVMLYGGDTTCANPVIDSEHRIISIDGGCVLKDDGQLNALILKDGEISWQYYDRFPTAKVISAQKGSGRSAYIRWGDNVVKVLKRGEEFSRVKHARTGYEMDILTKYLYEPGELSHCNDCTDYVLPLRAGDEVSVVESTSRGYLVKHKGVSGWYFGKLSFNA